MRTPSTIITASIALVLTYTSAGMADEPADFERAFDAARREILAGQPIWTASTEKDEEERAEKHLRTLVGDKASFLPRDPGEINIVLFVTEGEFAGDPWLAFACSNREGAHLFVICRNRKHSCSSRLFWTQTLSNRRPLRFELVSNRRQVDMILTELRIEGSLNQIEWTLGRPEDPDELVPGPVIVLDQGGGGTLDPNRTSPVPRKQWWGARWTGIVARPRTGWVFDDPSPGKRWRNVEFWWPNTDGVTLQEVDIAPREFAAHDAKAVSFLHDRDLVAVSDAAVYRIDVESGRVGEKRWFVGDARPDLSVFAFSPDGSRLFLSGKSPDAFLLDVEEATVRTLAEKVAGIPAGEFLNRDTLLLRYEAGLVEVDWKTKDWTALPFPAEVPDHTTVVGDLLVAGPFGEGGLRVIDLQSGRVLKKLESNHEHRLSLSPDARVVAQKSHSGLRLVDVTSGAFRWRHEFDTDFSAALGGVKWTPDGRYGATAGNRYAYLWCPAERWVRRVRHGRNGARPDVAISADGRRLAVVARDSKIAYWPELTTAPQPDEENDADVEVRIRLGH